MSKSLPNRPNLEHLKNQAKNLVRDYESGQVEALYRIKAHFPRLSNASVQEILEADFSLCHAQLVIAREYGFSTWKALSAAIEAPVPGIELVGESPALRRVKEVIARVASSRLPVLISGEPGTGKGIIAGAIHRLSHRTGDFAQVDCTVKPELLVESEIFGHEKGAFTGAHCRKRGKVELAGGTLSLGEVSALSSSGQARLQRLLGEGTFERLGGTAELRADVRILAVTEQDLGQLSQQALFRRDLALSLAALEVQAPPLRDCPEDIPRLAEHFMASSRGDRTLALSPEALDAMVRYEWPENTRELASRVWRGAYGRYRSTDRRRRSGTVVVAFASRGH